MRVEVIQIIAARRIHCWHTEPLAAANGGGRITLRSIVNTKL